MKPEPLDPREVANARIAPLERVLRRSRRIKAAVKRAARRLASATAVLKAKRANSSPRSVEQAINRYEKVEAEVASAAHDLTQVNTDLAAEVEGRADLESELADTKADLDDMKADLTTAHDDLSESQASEQEALHLALHDSLTGLPNRGLFDEGLDHALTQARRHRWQIAVFFIDVDDFKSINDSHGHQIGDEVLVMIADRLRSLVRAEDMVCRWGGDEYACLLLEVGQPAELTRLAQSMIDHIAEEFQSGDVTLCVRCSIGIATYPAGGESADVLLNNADKAMYEAKEASESVVLFRSEPPASDTPASASDRRSTVAGWTARLRRRLSTRR